MDGRSEGREASRSRLTWVEEERDEDEEDDEDEDEASEAFPIPVPIDGIDGWYARRCVCVCVCVCVCESDSKTEAPSLSSSLSSRSELALSRSVEPFARGKKDPELNALLEDVADVEADVPLPKNPKFEGPPATPCDVVGAGALRISEPVNAASSVVDNESLGAAPSPRGARRS